MIGKSHFHLDNITNELKSLEVCLHLCIAKCCLNCSRSQISDIGGIVEDIISTFNTNERNIEQNIWITSPPTSYEEIRKTTMKGKNSIFENLPQPVGIVVNNHAYFSVVEIVEIFLGLEFECLYLPDYNQFHTWYEGEVGNNINENDMKAAKSLAEKESLTKRLHLSVAIWHDDFDPSGSNKKNKNNVWILTLTFRKKNINIIIVTIHL